MTTDDIIDIFRDALFSAYGVPADFFILRVFIYVFTGAVTASALKHGRFAVTFFGTVFAALSAYTGLTYTAMPLRIFADARVWLFGGAQT